LANNSFDKIDTDVYGENKDKSITSKSYTDSFIMETSQTHVSTGEMSIRLVDDNKTVQRRPYRFSTSERELIRGKIQELLECKVIRPSQRKVILSGKTNMKGFVEN